MINVVKESSCQFNMGGFLCNRLKAKKNILGEWHCREHEDRTQGLIYFDR